MRWCGADSGFYTHAVVAVCRRMDVRFSIAIRQRARLHNLIEAIPEDAWTPIPYWMDGAADVAETTYTPFQAEADAAPVRLIVRRVKPAPGSQDCPYYWGFQRDRQGDGPVPRPAGIPGGGDRPGPVAPGRPCVTAPVRH